MATARVSALTTSAAHYQGVRRVYETALFYSAGPYNNWLCSAVLGALKLRPGHSLADVGGGSGMFASLLKECARSGTLAVVEPSAEMLEGAEQYPGVDYAVCADAGAWAAGNGTGASTTSLIPAGTSSQALDEAAAQLAPDELLKNASWMSPSSRASASPPISACAWARARPRSC